MIQSPCNSQCLYNNRLGICSSCKRTVEEIKNWVKYPEKEKQRIIKELENR